MKTINVYTVQGNYGQGWEDVTTEDTRKEALERLREYRENQAQYPHRIVKQRMMLDQSAQDAEKLRAAGLDPGPYHKGGN